MDSNYQALVDAVIQAETAGHPRHELVLHIGATPQCVQGVGFEDLPLVIKAKTVGKAYFDHCVALALLKRLPDIVGAPKAIFRSDTQAGSVVVLTFELHGGHPIVVPVAPRRQVGRSDFVNEVTSIYAKEGPNRIARWAQAGLLLWQP
ncbi:MULTISPECIES: hypothetical protein [Luteibacter]|uniref:MuF-C-terminal domain-containing protein n=1 Tax=Luteibacter sp. dw_328 TaxID=2719796 RepID=UPI0007BF153B|nr:MULTISPECIES: hypothetical protein [Luteibacter]